MFESCRVHQQDQRVRASALDAFSFVCDRLHVTDYTLTFLPRGITSRRFEPRLTPEPLRPRKLANFSLKPAWLISIENLVWQDIFALGYFGVIVFNDMLSFSLGVEIKKEIEYTERLMLIDLANFLLLALALVVISPTKNLFDVPLQNVAGYLGRSTFWLLLFFYLVISDALDVYRARSAGVTALHSSLAL
jgi:hypothetical protein